MVRAARREDAPGLCSKKWLKTPLGWARANLYYDKCTLPQYGSWAEYICLVVYRARVTQDIQQVRALAQAAVGGEDATKAFEDFRDVVLRIDKREREAAFQRALTTWTSFKGVTFDPGDSLNASHHHDIRHRV